MKNTTRACCAFFFLLWGERANTSPFDLAPYETYLNEIRTLSAKFSEHNQTGERSTGMIYISRPPKNGTIGRLRLTYDPPRRIDILVAQDHIVYCDLLKKETHYIALENSPLVFLLKAKISLTQDVVVKKWADDQITRLVCTGKDNPHAGSLTLVFKENPLTLQQWVLQQSNGIAIGVRLENLNLNRPIPSGAFQFQNEQ